MSVNSKPAEGTPVLDEQLTESAIYETGVTSTTMTAVWKIKDFAKFRQVQSLIKGQKIELDVTDNNGVSSQFRVSLIRTMKVGQIYRDNKFGASDEDKIGLCVKLLSKDEVAFKFCAEVKSGPGRMSCSMKTERITSACQDDDIIYPGLISNLWSQSTLPLEDEVLIIHLSFEIFSVISDSGLSGSIQMQNQHLSKLEKFMESLEIHTKSADVTIISNDGEKFPAHKFILMNISSVFEKMLNADMVEKKTGEIKLNLSGKCVKTLRHFIYTGKLADGWKEPGVVVELANAAQMYFLNDLVVFIDKVLGRICTAENAPELMVLANKLGMKRAQKQILNVVKTTTGNVDDFLAVAKRVSSE